MEIVTYRRQILDAMEGKAKGKDNFAIKVISVHNAKEKALV